MTPLPGALGGTELVAWRLDRAIYAPTWDSGEGAFRNGGRWSPRGTRAVYCALDPSTAIVEVAVHLGFQALDIEPFVLTAMTVTTPSHVFVVELDQVSNPNWLRGAPASAGQKQFGANLLMQHRFVVVPSVVSTHSWNLIFSPAEAKGHYALRSQERFALDTRLNPPKPK